MSDYNFPDLTSAEITLELPVKQEVILKDKSIKKTHYVVLKRLDELKKTTIKNDVMRLPSLDKEDLEGPETYQRWLSLVQIVINQSVLHYLDENQNIIHESTSYMNLQQHLTNVTLITYFTFIHVRDSYLLPTSYKCKKKSCGKITHYNYDPRSEIIEKEQDRDYMQDIRDFMRIKKAKNDYYFEYNFKYPYVVEDKDNKLEIRKFTIMWPTLSKYIRIYNDRKLKYLGDKQALFDSIIKINDLSEDDTKEIKYKLGFEKIINIPNETDASELFNLFLEPNLYFEDYLHTCPFCGYTSEHRFNTESFFSFLSR